VCRSRWRGREGQPRRRATVLAHAPGGPHRRGSPGPAREVVYHPGRHADAGHRRRPFHGRHGCGGRAVDPPPGAVPGHLGRATGGLRAGAGLLPRQPVLDPTTAARRHRHRDRAPGRDPPGHGHRRAGRTGCGAADRPGPPPNARTGARNAAHRPPRPWPRPPPCADDTPARRPDATPSPATTVAEHTTKETDQR